MAVEMVKTRNKMMKSVYTGQTLLDSKKLVMYEFYYDCMVPKFTEKLQLCHVDKDRFNYQI